MDDNFACLAELIDGYIEKCIKDAYQSENRTYDENKVSFFYVILEIPDEKGPIKKEIHVNIKTQYERVTRKAQYRFINNVQKNFGLKPGEYYTIEDGDTLQVAFVCNKFCVQKGNKKANYYINDYKHGNTPEEGKVLKYAGRYEKLCMAYHDVGYDTYTKDTHGDYTLPYGMGWEEYIKVYEKAYGKTCRINIVYLGCSKNMKIQEVSGV